MSGHLDVALPIQNTSITVMIVFIYLHIMDTGIVVTVLFLLIRFLVAVSIPSHPLHFQHYHQICQLFFLSVSQLVYQQYRHQQSHPPLDANQDGHIIKQNVIILAWDQFIVGQVVSRYALH